MRNSKLRRQWQRNRRSKYPREGPMAWRNGDTVTVRQTIGNGQLSDRLLYYFEGAALAGVSIRGNRKSCSCLLSLRPMLSK